MAIKCQTCKATLACVVLLGKEHFCLQLGGFFGVGKS